MVEPQIYMVWWCRSKIFIEKAITVWNDKHFAIYGVFYIIKLCLLASKMKRQFNASEAKTFVGFWSVVKLTELVPKENQGIADLQKRSKLFCVLR